MKTRLPVLVLIVLLSLTACAGREGRPVMAVQYGDEEKSCKALKYEISATEQEMQRLLPKTSKTGQNVVLGVTGWFLLVPWFFMDFKNGEKEEYEAYRQRYNHLNVIAADKNCKVKPGNYPSLDEMRQQYEAQKKNRTQGE